MASKPRTKQIALQPRDYELFDLLYCVPGASSDQVWRASQTFVSPLASLDRAQRRLRALHRTGFVHRYAYRTIEGLGPAAYYYKLTLAGYRELLGDPTADPPTQRFFGQIAPGNYRHDYFVTEVTVRTMLAAHTLGIRIENFQPMGTETIAVDGQSVVHDGAYDAVLPSGRVLRHIQEIDRSTETRRAGKKSKSDTWEKKLRVYDQYANVCATTDRPVRNVLVFTTQSRQRAENILQQFGQQTANPNRVLVRGVYVQDFFHRDDPLGAPIFADHRRDAVPLIPPDLLAVPAATTKARPTLELAATVG